MKKLLSVSVFATAIFLLISAGYKPAEAFPNSQSNPNSAIPVWITTANSASSIQYTGTLSTNAITAVAASGIGSSHVNYVQLSNTSGTAQTVAILNGPTIIWQVQAAASSSFAANVNLIGSASTVLNVQNVTGTGSVIVNIQGAQY